MVTWEDIETAINNFWNWLTSTAGEVTAGFTDTLGELGSWIFGGLKWLADQIYNGITWLADKVKEAWQWFADRLHDAYNYLAEWIGGGLQWISSGLSWIGQHLYSLGQWIWNGILWVAHTIANIIESVANWIWQQLMNIWNLIVNTAKNWIKSINDFLNDWFKSLREKLMMMITANFTFLGFEKAVNLFGRGKFKHGLGMMIASPIVGAIVGHLIDAIIPTPQSQRVMFFPELDIEEVTPTPVSIPKPPIPTEPTESPTTAIPTKPPALGYIPNVESELKEGYELKVEVTYRKIPAIELSESYELEVYSGKYIPITVEESESAEGSLVSGAIVNSAVELGESLEFSVKAIKPINIVIEEGESIENELASGIVASVETEESESESYEYEVPIIPVSSEIGESEDYETVVAEFQALYIKTYTFELTNFVVFEEGKYAKIEIPESLPIELCYQKGYAFELTYNIEKVFNLVATYDFESGYIP